MSGEGEEKSIKEQRIRKITHLYYSKPEIQEAIFSFSADREICPRYFEGFGKRPDSFQYPNDVFELVKKGATSFHCSEELWKDPLKIETGMPEKQLNELRKGWDLLIDIDSKYLDYSKVSAQVILNFLKFYGVKNVGIKFSGSKGFHLIVPWKALPKEINSLKTSDKFPEWARIVVQFIVEHTKKELVDKITDLTRPNRYIRDYKVSEEVMPDLILVSPRHLFRMPYSLHEKTALASIVINETELSSFQPSDADPIKVKIRNFMPNPMESEASKLFMEALDWFKTKSGGEKARTFEGEEGRNFKPIKFEKLSESQFPPSIQKILLGVKDGKKRGLFILLNFFRYIGMEKDEIEKRLVDWNKKNSPSLMDGYVKTQLLWSFRKQPVMPPNYDKDYYKGIGVSPTTEEIQLKNPVNYMIKKNFRSLNKPKKQTERN